MVFQKKSPKNIIHTYIIDTLHYVFRIFAFNFGTFVLNFGIFVLNFWILKTLRVQRAIGQLLPGAAKNATQRSKRLDESDSSTLDKKYIYVQ